MLPPAPTCRRALQRQLYTPSDSIWISDEALSLVFQRFCAVSKTRKRYGSFVPGPLESRRRLGKRRMTLQSNAAPAPAFSFAALWGSFGEVDRTRWQWEAPTTRSTETEEAPSDLPKWLVEWDTTSEALPESRKQTTSTPYGLAKAIPFIDEAESFRKALKKCSPEDIPSLCDDFNRKLTKTLSLSLDSEEILRYVVNSVYWDLKKALWGSNEASHRCLALCQAIWDGISTSKVLPPSDIRKKTISRFAAILCDVPMSESLQNLATAFFSSVSRAQLQVMHSSLIRLVDAWVLSWEGNDAVLSHAPSLAAADLNLSGATRAVASVSILAASLGKGSCSEQELQAFHQALQTAREAILLSADSIQTAETLIVPHERSIQALAATLGYLPPKQLRTIVLQCSKDIPKTSAYNTSSAPLEHSWLSLVSQLPNVDEPLLLDTWRQFGAFIKHGLATDIILKHWISRDIVKRPALSRILFDVTAYQHRRRGLSTMLSVIDGARENCWDKMRRLFRFLDKLGHHQTLYQTLICLNELRIKIPADVMDETLERLAIGNPTLAQKAFRLYSSMRYNEVPLRLSRCPTFVISMIDNPKINPSIIWKSLGIPLYESLPRRSLGNMISNKSPTEKPLWPATVKYFTQMATAFAHCNGRTQRVAFRNVMQCLFHLRLHNAPITPEFTRAMVHVGISKKILSDGWIAKERAEWLLELIEQVEGTDVALTVEEIVAGWNLSVSARVSKRDRDKNVLSVGLID